MRMSSRPRDNQARCPYCHRSLRGQPQQKFCPDCGQALPSPSAPRYNAMMKGARYVAGAFGGRACPLEVIAMIAATMALYGGGG
jgi:ribosomal protein L34E